MSIVNLQRDATFSDPDASGLSFGTAVTVGESLTILAHTDAIVNEVYGQARGSRDNSVTLTTDARVLGLFMRPPGTDLSPYRVKCYAGSNDPLLKFRLIIGYSSNVIDGSNDNVTPWRSYAFTNQIDDLFMLSPEDAATDAPIFFGIMVSGAVTAADADITLSVQRLATSPPQFDQSVS